MVKQESEAKPNMIDYDRTLSVIGVDVNKLSYGSGKRVFAVCEECGKYRKVIYRAYHDLCKSCSKTKEKNPNFGKCLSKEHRKRISEAHKGKNHPMFGKHHTEESKKKMRSSHKGVPLSEEHKKNIGISIQGKQFTERRKKKISESLTGKKFTEERREKMLKNVRRGKDNPLYGIPRTEEVRRKVSASHQGIPYDEWESYAAEALYCPKFDDDCRESNRSKYDCKCFICGLPESENIDGTGKPRKLSVHHVDCNKQQGCNGIRWKLVPICMKHHTPSHSKLWEARIVYLLDNAWCG